MPRSEVLPRPGQKFGSSFLLHVHRFSASGTTTSGTRNTIEIQWQIGANGKHQAWKAKGTQAALEFWPIHCPNGRLGQDLGFGGSAFALKLPELVNRNLVAVRAKLGQRSCFPNGPQIWCQIGQ